MQGTNTCEVIVVGCVAKVKGLKMFTNTAPSMISIAVFGRVEFPSTFKINGVNISDKKEKLFNHLTICLLLL